MPRACPEFVRTERLPLRRRREEDLARAQILDRITRETWHG